jgi:G3E family GTPase
MDKIEVFIITGFLGAGKTTILNELLKIFPNNNGIIENEFGQVNIDTTLIDSKFESMYELTNGCICCSLDADLYSTLHTIVTDNKKIKRLFIESTGIADAGNIASIFKKPDVAKFYQLIKVICVVDSFQILENIKLVNEVTRQIISSDLILLNKCKGVNLDDIRNKIKFINPFSIIVDCSEKLFDKEWLTIVQPVKSLFFRPIIQSEYQHEINSVLYESHFKINIELLRESLKKLLDWYYHQIFRIKGFVIGDNNRMYLVQSTGQDIFISIPPCDVENKNKLIIIGRKIELNTIERIIKPSIVKDL